MRLKRGGHFYSANAGLPELRKEICRYLKRRFQLEYAWNSDILVTVGGSEAIDICLPLVIESGR